MASLDEANPFEALIAQAGDVPTVLDRSRMKSPLLTQQKTSDPVIVLDNSNASEGENIGLGFRQPSFSNLAVDNVVTKGGDVVDSKLVACQEDPVIVFDAHSNSSADENIPIGLTVRQPSFVSLHGQVIPKGSDSLAEFQPVLEEAEPHQLDEVDLDEEEDDDPQVQLVKELKVKNQDRWQEMGYEPPADLIPLARAASQSKITPLQPKPQEKTELETVVSEEHAEEEQVHEVVIAISDNMEEEESVNEADLELPPGTHFLELDESLTCMPVRRLLATGEVDYNEDLPRIREQLRQIIEICSDHLWIEETQYCNELLEVVNQGAKKTKVLGFTRDDPMADLENLHRERNEIFKKMEEQVEKLKDELDALIAVIDEEYKVAAQALDDKYQDPATLQKYAKPSKELLELRVVAKRLLKQNRIQEATRYTSRIRKLEAQEEAKLNQFIKEKYHDEDRKMKDAFVKRREIAATKYRQKIKVVESECNRCIEVIDKRIAKIEVELVYETPMEQRLPEWKRTDCIHRDLEFKVPKRGSENASAASDNEPIDFLENGVLVLSPPTLLKRGNDIDILDRMTEFVLDQKSPKKKANVNAMYRQSRKGNMKAKK